MMKWVNNFYNVSQLILNKQINKFKFFSIFSIRSVDFQFSSVVFFFFIFTLLFFIQCFTVYKMNVGRSDQHERLSASIETVSYRGEKKSHLYL